MAMRAAAMLLVAVAAASRGPDYAEQARSVRRAMEGARQEAAGLAAWEARRPGAAAAAESREEGSPAESSMLDLKLMQAADRISEDLRGMQAAGAKASMGAGRKKAVLAAQGTETQQGKAARYFASHGLEHLSQLLGYEAMAVPAQPSPAVEVGGDDDYRRSWGAVDSLRLRRPAPAA
eukprot:CAMPEP_0204593562 /NCGR_PEP_ID=MMETSP0661-20131031/51580_1 /ASSEMBLY_ACC=CAM_ASM_000606 /TAXON_ID=109239 /ORGANISM="Alexandrium margalefi, Strain AMGDE01CS-322" /LENGTH=177 /DNA_ID=CAMNT_0051603883 /DNA_START=61 /DNA_END=591 /DNA_ORIENTATION=-